MAGHGQRHIDIKIQQTNKKTNTIKKQVSNYYYDKVKIQGIYNTAECGAVNVPVMSQHT
jgi:hypothetical protein